MTREEKTYWAYIEAVTNRYVEVQATSFSDAYNKVNALCKAGEVNRGVNLKENVEAD